VNIATKRIPGYMAAMTMSFEAGSPGQLEGFAAGDKITFSFRSERMAVSPDRDQEGALSR